MQRAAADVGLDHDHGFGQGGDDPVAHREPPGLGPGAQRSLGEQQAPLPYVVPEPGVAAGVDHVEPRSDDGHRWRGDRGVERPGVGRAVDAQGEARHHGDARRGQVPPELAGHLDAVAGALAGAHDGDPPGRQRLRVAAGEEHGGGLLVVDEVGRIPGVAPDQDLDPGPPERLPGLAHVDPRRGPRPGGGHPVGIGTARLGDGRSAEGPAPQDDPPRLGRLPQPEHGGQPGRPHGRQPAEGRGPGAGRELVGSPEVGCRAHAAQLSWAVTRSARSPRARATCSSSRTVGAPARSATVRATRRTR